mmetsp:Transcript_26700/g.36856  ORF Transcript_26700/g.36856 Transcript_26700/m.36856 type:complete len:288 (+) Transcript_26700:43-906(+)
MNQDIDPGFVSRVVRAIPMISEQCASNSSSSTFEISNFSGRSTGVWPCPIGLSLGLISVIVGQLVVILYLYVWLRFGNPTPIQKAGAQQYSFSEALRTHVSEPGGFFLLGSYLIGTWMFNLMPESYYSFEGGVQPLYLLAQLLSQDCIQTVMHYAEHKIHPYLYKQSHKPHHRFINPRWADAYNGSVADTVCMILIPLWITANIVHCNSWTYMAFGTTYSSWLTLIHSECSHPWDPLCRKLGIGTAGDHHVHHRTFTWNYGHLFMYWDRMLGTYKSPMDVNVFRKDI